MLGLGRHPRLTDTPGVAIVLGMCRYAQTTYKEPFACFDCRKSFKQRSRWELPPSEQPAKGKPRCVLCPQCRQPMADMGRDFKPPKQADRKQWKKIELLFRHGFTFHSCGCCGPGLRPDELKEVAAFLAASLPKSAGELLLGRIAERTRR